jgi:hypothetical protein
MSLPADTLATYQAIGNREDLSDVIYRIDPTDTPFMSGIEREKATAVNHEWQIQELAAVGANAVLEGSDAITDAVTVTVRTGNIAQISDKVARVTGTQRSVDAAGRDDELAYQETLKGLELKRDMEYTLVGTNQGKVTGDTTTARKLGTVLSWLKTNQSASGTAPATAGTNSRTTGTQRAFTEAQLKTVLSAIWTAGGKPDVISAGAFNKQQFSTFVGRASVTEDAKSKKIVATVDAYESDFGTLKVVANRFQSTRDVFIFQMDMWAVAYLPGRKMVSLPLAKTGDSDRRQILSEFTLVSRNEKASGIVADLTTS